MDTSKQFKDLKLADLIKIGDELIQVEFLVEFYQKSLFLAFTHAPVCPKG